jgi:hypothetical protein
MLENIWVTLKDFFKHFKIMMLLSIILAIIPAYYAIIDHEKKSEIEIKRENIKRNKHYIDSLYKESYKKYGDVILSLYATQNVCHLLDKSNPLSDYAYLKEKKLNAIDEYINNLDETSYNSIMEIGSTFDAFGRDLFTFSEYDQLDSLRFVRGSLISYEANLYFKIEDAFIEKINLRKSHIQNIRECIEKEDKHGVFKELEKWYNDVNYYELDELFLEYEVGQFKKYN